MRHILLKTVVVLTAMAGLFSACEEGDGDKDYGFAYIYMPQAASITAGIDTYYAVPQGATEHVYNFSVDGDRLNVFLSVLRSGKLSNAEYSVDVLVQEEQAHSFVESDVLANDMVMPPDIYTLPEKVTVSGDKDGAAFYLAIDVPALSNPDFTGKSLVISVAIANPTKFELAASNTSVMLVLDVDSILEIIKKINS
jgi:hypothetical protein